MEYSMLPPVLENKKLNIPHFPTAFHTAVFRLWETVSKEQIAKGLGVTLSSVLKAAEDMGLPPQKNTELWQERGFITTIRNAWHILPYEQLLGVLGWSEEKLAKILREEDFLNVKLGRFKPYCETVKEEPLSDEQKVQLLRIKKLMETDGIGMFSGKAPFDFFCDEEVVPCENKETDKDGIRMVFSYQGLITTALDNDIEFSFPEKLLKSYKANGINAIWISAVLYQLVSFPFDESYSEGFQKRQEKLRQLVKLCGKYDIKIYLYLNEPRCMPLAFFEKYPELMGRKNEDLGEAALCTSNPAVLEYLKSGIQSLCQSVPGLGGFFLINQSENLTHCKSRAEGEECPKCKDVPHPKLIADVVNAIYDGAMEVDPTIRVIAWTWAWDAMTPDECKTCIDLLPKGVILQSNSEAKIITRIGGIESELRDYSISIPGPGDWSRGFWEHARSRGMETGAKVQLNVTWECSTIPFIPTFDLIREHMIGLKKEGIKHLMMSWTLGGYPSINLKVASRCLENPDEADYDALLIEEFGDDWEKAKKASSIFSEAFRNFPFHVKSAYRGPQNPGPSNLLYKEPTGFQSTMTCYCYDDLEEWRSIYPKEIYREQFKKLSDGWKCGLSVIEDMEDCAFKQMAWAAYLLFYSSYLQVDFIMKRDSGDTGSLKEIVKKERENALLMYQLMQKNPAIGFEAANHYYYNRGMLIEKIISCDYLAEQL